MSYVPGCRADVFISYAHRDNLDGWVSRLKDRLTGKLNPFLAGRAEVWFDDRIQPGVYFKEEIQGKLKNTPILLSVVSPSYLDSPFCMLDELEWFQNRGGKEVVQLLKVPLEEGQSVPLAEVQFQVLYDETDGHLLDGVALDKALDRTVETSYRRLRELWELRPKIYLTQLRNEDLTPGWEKLRVRLHEDGFAVLPKGVLTARAPDGQIRGWLEKAALSVHLDRVPDDPLAERQLAIARLTGRETLVLPDPPAEDQLPEIVRQVRERLESGRPPSIYLIYDHHSDRARVAALPDLIRSLTGFEVLLPEAGEKYHKFCLEVSRGVLLFRGDAPKDWLEAQNQSLLQAAALRKSPVVEARYSIRLPNGRPVGVDVSQGTRQEWIIERTGEPDPIELQHDLQPFFDALRRPGGDIS